MKWLFALVLLSVFMKSPVCSQVSEEELNLMREWFKEINTQTDDTTCVNYADINVYKDLNPDKYSIEGSDLYALGKVDLTKCYEGKNLVKMVVKFFGDREDLTSAYYLRNGELFFVDKEKMVYKRPKWHEEFDISEKSILKNRFYIKNYHILKWISARGFEVTNSNPDFFNTQASIQNDFNLYLQIK